MASETNPLSSKIARRRDADPTDEIRTTPDASNTAPDWDKVPFDVACARCGHDLRGLTEPQCPSCKLTFDWAHAVPLERLTCKHCDYHLYGLTKTRCPECGESFTWDEALDAYHRRSNPLFEYQWRDHFFRSIIKTWWLALWPPRLWRTVTIYDPPQVKPLVGFVLCTLVMLFALDALLLGLLSWLWQGNLLGGRGGLSQLPLFLVRWLGSASSYTQAPSVAVWVAGSIGALLIFRQSMRRCRIRVAHVVRVWAYALVVLINPALLLTFVQALVDTVVGGAPGTTLGIAWIDFDLILVLVVLSHATWSIWMAYRLCLRMPHSFSVAVCAQAIAVLWTVTVCGAISVDSYGFKIFYELLKIVGLA